MGIDEQTLNKLSTKDLEYFAAGKMDKMSTQGLNIIASAPTEAYVTDPSIPTPMGTVQPKKVTPSRTFGEQALGAGEAALSTLTGMTSGTLSGFTNMFTPKSPEFIAAERAQWKKMNPNEQYIPAEQAFFRGAERATFSPRTEAGQEYAGNISDFVNSIGLQGLMGMPSTPKVNIAPKQAANIVKNKTLQQAQKAGYIVPPSTTNPSFVNRTLESIAGKDATKQAVSIKNQEVTDNLTKRALGLPEDTPLTASSLNDYRKIQAQIGYDPIRELEGEFTLPKVTISNPIKSATGKPVTREVIPTVSPSQAIDQLSELRAKSNDAWNSYAKTSKGKDRAKSLEKQAADLELAIESNLKQRGLDDLIPQFKTARQNIAKSFTVSNAIVEGSGSVNAQKIASEFEKDKPLTGDLATIGSFANTFPNATMNPKYIGSQGVSKMQFGLGSILGGLGALSGGASTGGLGFALPFVAPPLAKELILSSPYQRSFSTATPKTSILQKGYEAAPYIPYMGLLNYQNQGQ